MKKETNSRRTKILLIEGDPQEARRLREILAGLKNPPVTLKCASHLQAGFSYLKLADVDLILLDLTLPGSQALDTVAKIHAQAPEVSLVVLTESDSELGVRAIEQGARDFISKDEVDVKLLSRIVRYSAEHQRLRAELALANSEVQSILKTFPDIFFRMAPDGTILSYGAGRESDLYLPPEKFLGKKMHRVLPADVGRRFKKAMAQVLKTGGVVCLEYSLSVPAGEKIFEAKLLPLAGREIIAIVRDVSERKQSEERLTKINECFLKFGADPIKNINRLVGLCGETLGAACALYSRLEGGMLCSLGQWKVPADYNLVDKAAGRICYDVIKNAKDDILVVRDLPHTPYAKTDLNIIRYQLETYVGKVVKFVNTPVGSLCALYQKDFVPDETDIRIMGIIASAIGVEEERQQSETALRKSEETLLAAQKTAQIGNWEWDLAMNKLYWSEENYRIFGLDPRKIKPSFEVFLNTVEPADLEFVKKSVEDALGGRKPYDIDFRIIRPDGTGRIVNAKAQVTFGGTGKAVKMAGTIQDITERRKAAEALEESEVKFRLAFENAQDALLWADAATMTIINCNKAAEGLLEKPKSEIIGQHQETLHPPESYDYCREVFKKHASDDEPAPIELPIITKSGKIKIASIAPSVVIVRGKKILQGIFRDVTESRQAEEALRVSEAKFKALAEQSIAGTCLIQDGKFVYVNPRLAEILDFKPEEIVGLSVLDLVTDPDRDMVRENMRKRLSGEMKYLRYTLHALKKGGASVLLEVYGTVLEYLGRPAIMATLLDITERKRMEEALYKSEERYHKMVDAVTLYTYSVDVVKGRAVATHHSDEGLAVTGYAPEDYAKNLDLWHIMIHPDDRKTVEGTIRRLLAGEEVIPVEHRIIRRDGGIIWVRNTHVPYRDEQGQLIRYDGLVEDITERKRAEEKMREQSTAMAASMDGIGLLYEKKGYVYLNEAHAKIYGYDSSKELIGKSWQVLYNEKERKRIEEQVFPRLIKDGKWRGEAVGKKRDGTLFPQEISLTTMENSGIVCIVRDITERKKAEEALRFRIEFEKLITAISTNFINITSEEIDNEINRALKTIGEFVRVDRSYIFRFLDNTTRMGNTHEWCADGIESHLQQLKNMSINSFPFFSKRIKQPEVVHIPRVADLPPEAINEKEFLQSQGVKSLINIPMVYAGTPVGFLGFDSVHNEKTWAQDTIGLLNIIAGIFVNALERKRTDEILRVSEAKLRQVIDLTPNFIFAKNREGRFVIVNKAVADNYGTTVEELLGKKDADFAKSEEEVKHFREDDMEVIQSGKRKFIPEEVITDDKGKIHVLQTTKIPFKITGTDESAVLGVSVDITELKEKEESLRTLSHAIEQSPSIIIITDIKGNIEYVNPRFTDITGYFPEEVIGKNPRILKSGGIPQEEYKKMWDTIASGDAWRGELPNKKKNGELFWAQAAVSPIKDEQGGIVHFLAIEQDVTERKKAEEELDDYRKHLEELVEERTRELRHSERLAATGRLAASIAHEINNPLQGITTHLEIVRDSLPENFEKTKNYEFVKSNIEKIRSIVMKLLDTYRGTDEGKTSIAVNEIIDRVAVLVEHQLKMKGIRLKLNLAKNIPLIQGWRQQLYQVFLNLVLNAQDSIKQGGEITITTSHDGGMISIQVGDTGEGIRPEDMNRLFEPFFTTKAESGTGLGLFVSQGIVKEHNGLIKAKSELGKGSIFTVTLPIGS